MKARPIRRKIITVLLVVLTWSATRAAAQSPVYPVVANRAFTVGECLTFSVDYGPIHAGTATLEVRPGIPHYGRETWQIISVARSSTHFDAFFKVEDRTVSTLDRAGLFSWGIRKILREGSFHRDVGYHIDYPAGIIYSLRDTVVNGMTWEEISASPALASHVKDTVSITGITQDALSALYYIRTQPLKIGDTLHIPTFDNKKHYISEVRVRARESIKVTAGVFDTIRLEPRLKYEGIFRNKSRITVWVTNDRRRMPVQMTTRLFFGSITASLVSFETGDSANAR